METVRPTLYIVEENREVSDSLARLAASVGLGAMVFTQIQVFLEHYDPGAPGCLILGVRSPDTAGMTTLARREELQITVPIIMLSERDDVATAVRAMKLGAEDFVTIPYEDRALIESIQEAVEYDAAHRDIRTQQQQVRTRIGRLTPRERQVMDLVVAGKPNKAVAADLSCSGKTVEVHRARVMEKMEAESLPHLVRMAILVEDICELASGRSSKITVSNEPLRKGVAPSTMRKVRDVP